MKKTTITRFLILILSAILLQACGGAAKRTGGVASQDIEVLIRQAINAPANKKDGLLIEAAGLLVLDSRYDKAQELLIHVNQNKLMPTQQDDFKLYYAETLIALGANEAALKQITGIKASSKKSIKWQVRYGTALADIYLVNGNYYEAAKTRIELNDLFTNSKLLQENNEKIWLALDQIEPEFLKSYTTSFNNKRLNGWLELVYINKKWGHDPQKLLAEIRGWKNRYPLHQAQTHQPKILVQTSSAKPYKPTHIAVMLPLSGKNEKVGKMIHDGIIAAHYQNQNAASAPKISFHDTAKTGSVMGLYKKSINDGADFILGPLLKNAVEELITQEELQIPVLALNRLEEVQLLDPKVFQFGLPIEDEAVLAAERAIEKGYKKAIAFLPENSTGSRAEKSFKAHFESLGGTLVYVQKYKSAKNLKQDVQSLLGVNKSMSRKLSLEQLLGRNLEFEMRRREDADFVFVLANHSLGRQIKP
ncbi:MAG: penicillin-binding protein activator, partial [Gammaproteobacteria bacterium]|nr:penicillin-binding protein activator [Gammaproteobacteria bacterium]